MYKTHKIDRYDLDISKKGMSIKDEDYIEIDRYIESNELACIQTSLHVEEKTSIFF